MSGFVEADEALRRLEGPGWTVREEVPFSELGSFKLGGPSRYVLDCHQTDALHRARTLCLDSGLPHVLIGEGTNILFSDSGWPGLCVRYAGAMDAPSDRGDHLWRVNAAMSLERLVDEMIQRGEAGLEAFSGIPGTVGGAVVGNAGAWGVQMEHLLVSVFGVDARGNPVELPAADCGFQYRDSELKQNRFWVADCVIRTRPGNPEELKAERERILTLRAERHPDWRSTPCIGSFFKNIQPSSAAERRQAAGWFLEQAGAKSMREGGAAVFPGHANILIKDRPDCRAADVAALARSLRQEVQRFHGLDLVREVRYLGDIPGESGGDSFY